MDVKTTIAILSAAIFCFSAFGEPTRNLPPPARSLADRVQNAEIIAFVSLSNATTNTFTDSAGQQLSFREADGTIERMLKGTPTKRIRVKQEIAKDVPAWAQVGSSMRFLFFAKRSGDAYMPSGPYDLAPVYGTGLDTDRVVWPACDSVAEAITKIEKKLKN